MSFHIPNDWQYRGEGNCHVVLSLPQLKKVLRIRKKNKPNNIYEWFIHLFERYFSRWIWWNIDAEKRDSLFHSDIMMPLLGFNYVSAAENVLLSSHQLRKVELVLNELRPDFRKHKVLQYGRATLFHDFTYMDADIPLYLTVDDTYSFEIKPKKGWIPNSEKHFPKCVFCMTQFLKLDSKKISKLSEYCPELFFSGNEEDIRRSIKALLENPQNNLKIFKNGNLIFGENCGTNSVDIILPKLFEVAFNSGLVDDLTLLLYKCLKKNFIFNEKSSKCVKCMHNFSSSNTLPEGSVLERIMSVQRLDSKGAKHYKDLISEELSEFSYVDKLLKLIHGIDCSSCIWLRISELKNSLSSIPYLVAAVANDCSLMVTLKKMKRSNTEINDMDKIVSSKYGDFFVQIGVFDLYPKPFSTTRKHQLRNEELLERFTKIL